MCGHNKSEEIIIGIHITARIGSDISRFRSCISVPFSEPEMVLYNIICDFNYDFLMEIRVLTVSRTTLVCQSSETAPKPFI